MYLVFKLDQRDYRKWRPVFDSLSELRRRYGEVSVRRYLGWENHVEVLVACGYPSHVNIDAFLADPAIDSALYELGHPGYPRLMRSLPSPKVPAKHRKPRPPRG